MSIPEAFAIAVAILSAAVTWGASTQRMRVLEETVRELKKALEEQRRANEESRRSQGERIGQLAEWKAFMTGQSQGLPPKLRRRSQAIPIEPVPEEDSGS